MFDFLHKRADFSDLLNMNIVAERDAITPTLVEKDYWIMHCLWGLKNQAFQFELKGGTSLSVEKVSPKRGFSPSRSCS